MVRTPTFASNVFTWSNVLNIVGSSVAPEAKLPYDFFSNSSVSGRHILFDFGSRVFILNMNDVYSH